MPNYPGQLTYIRKNLYSVVFFLDLSTLLDRGVMAQIFEFIQGSVPIRFGIIPIVNQDLESPGRIF
jgi:UDP-glucose:glycoprotein glucosyltransferase